MFFPPPPPPTHTHTKSVHELVVILEPKELRKTEIARVLEPLFISLSRKKDPIKKKAAVLLELAALAIKSIID